MSLQFTRNYFDEGAGNREESPREAESRFSSTEQPSSKFCAQLKGSYLKLTLDFLRLVLRASVTSQDLQPTLRFLVLLQLRPRHRNFSLNRSQHETNIVSSFEYLVDELFSINFLECYMFFISLDEKRYNSLFLSLLNVWYRRWIMNE